MQRISNPIEAAAAPRRSKRYDDSVTIEDRAGVNALPEYDWRTDEELFRGLRPKHPFLSFW